MFQQLYPLIMAATSGFGCKMIAWVTIFMLMASSWQAEAGIIGCWACISSLGAVCSTALATGKPSLFTEQRKIKKEGIKQPLHLTG
jgi:hypothetical protein